MRAVEVSRCHMQLFRLVIHLFKEVLGIVRMIVELVTFDPRYISVSVLPSEKLFSKKLGKRKRSVVATW